MRKIFTDTSAFLSLLNRSDEWHAKAREVELSLKQDRCIWVTTEFIVLELADALCNTYWRSLTIGFIDMIRGLELMTIVPLSSELLNEGLSLYESRLDKDWGLTDCISFVVMQQEGITEAFTTDKHFEQAGFIRLLK